MCNYTYITKHRKTYIQYTNILVLIHWTEKRASLKELLELHWSSMRKQGGTFKLESYKFLVPPSWFCLLCISMIPFCSDSTGDDRRVRIFTYSLTRIKDQVGPVPYFFYTFICMLLQKLWLLWTVKGIISPTSNEGLHSE